MRESRLGLSVAIYVTIVGCLFSLLPIVQTDLIEFKTPNKYYLVGFALILIMCGCWYIYAALKGRLEPADVSVVDIRKEALEKIESEAYLAKTAKDDPDPDVRQKAPERLKKIAE